MKIRVNILDLSGRQKSQVLYDILCKEVQWPEGKKPQIVLKENKVAYRDLNFDPFIIWILTTIGNEVISKIIEVILKKLMKKIDIIIEHEDGRIETIGTQEEAKNIKLHEESEISVTIKEKES